MKTIFAFAFLCLAFTNAFYLLNVQSEDLSILQNPTDSDTSSFNETAALQGFLEGLMAGAAHISELTDSASCLTGSGVTDLYDYYYGLALAAGTSSPTSSVEAARAYLTSAGARKFSSLPSGFVSCLTGSDDFASIEDAWDVNPSGSTFADRFSALATGDTAYFQATFRNIYNQLSSGEYQGAGYLYGSFCKDAALSA